VIQSFLSWLQYSWGSGHTADGSSYSLTLLQSLNFWGLLEGTHLLTLMAFFGTILIVDLRLLGVVFPSLPISVINKRLLPLTTVSMVIIFATGGLLFFSKPELYFHNLWFRLKMIVLALAMINIYVFHHLVQKNQDAWDAAPSPPAKAKAAAILSLLSWVLVIGFGRISAYAWLDCGTPQAAWLNAAEGCKTSSLGERTQDPAPTASTPSSTPPEAK
jgi:hypothetical protein